MSPEISRPPARFFSTDRKQARVAMRYLRSLFTDHPILSELVENETQESLQLSNRVVIEVATASYRTTRGYTIAAVLADEIAFWMDGEGSANPAGEIITALRPAMSTMKNSLASSGRSSRRISATTAKSTIRFLSGAHRRRG